MNSNPLVSVVVCTYNAERFIDSTLRSVLNQTYDNIEVLVLDNGSDDDTVEKISALDDDRVTLFESEENLGPYRGLNDLIDRAGGEYVAVQDHDDIWHERKTELQIRILEEYPEYVGAGSRMIRLFENQDQIAITRSGDRADTKAVPHTTLVFRNDGYRYDTAVGYKTDMYFMEHILCNQGRKLYTVDKPLTVSLVRDDNGNLSNDWTTGLPSNVITYYKKTGDDKRLVWGLLMSILPVPVANRVKQLVFREETRSVDYLDENEFLETYKRYITPYVRSGPSSR